jgi:Fe-S cluster assembly ATP-binding protein
MNTPLLSIANLQISVESKIVVDKIQLELDAGELAIIVGPNGGGKSSLTQALMGDVRYLILDGSKIEFEKKNLLAMTSDERSRAGLYVAWQSPVSIPGVSVFSLCKASVEARGSMAGSKFSNLVEFKKYLEELAEKVGLPKEYIARNVNEGFSGGERKRLELLQLLLLRPKLAILDEIDSGLDSHGVQILTKIIREMKEQGTSFILITHSKKLLDESLVDKIWEMRKGSLNKVPEI